MKKTHYHDGEKSLCRRYVIKVLDKKTNNYIYKDGRWSWCIGSVDCKVCEKLYYNHIVTVAIM